ncbi:metal-dependent hydrolase [Ensifer adhaerens]|uniref:metal-dependent hydrolase n=1 Tax=Ensifer adhaerens TaxID=106592 RepID=UPI0023A935FA|nr:metal-dependent hydrolase [Ensifer adhaerens]WDZ75109.1 metal-dependent hydrolase [Ensifer adhaerens]
MFIAHLPAGYLLSRPFARRNPQQARAILGVELFCSVLPDFDLAYFYLVDQRRTPHHDYWVHTPVFWLAVAAAAAVLLVATGRRRQLILVGVGLLSVLMHLAMDSIAADIRWLFPVSDLRLNLVHVPALYQPWYLNFLLHWSFALEMLIVALAAGLAVGDIRTRRPAEAGLV